MGVEVEASAECQPPLVAYPEKSAVVVEVVLMHLLPVAVPAEVRVLASVLMEMVFRHHPSDNQQPEKGLSLETRLSHQWLKPNG